MGLVISGSPVRSTQSHDRAWRLVAAGLVLLLAFLGIPRLGQAQDVPPPPSNFQLIPKGSLVIPMDLAHQSLVAPFNIRAYGLANHLLQNNIPLKWAIAAGKSKDGIDFTAQARRIAPSTTSPAVRNFRSGPFIIHESYAAAALPLISAFGGNVAVYELTQDATIDIRHDLIIKPRPFVNTKNSDVATDVLDAAGIFNYTVGNDFSLLAGSCFTIVMEPHTDDNTGVSAVRAFLQNGGNLLAQCRSVHTYENDVNGHFLTTLGIAEHNIGNALAYPNPDLSFSQFEGILDPAPGGSHQDWELLPGSAFQNSAHIHADDIGASPPTYAALVGKIFGGQGGLAFYLGGHDWSGSSDLEMINGQRMMLNAVMTPPTRPLSCGLYILLPDLLSASKTHVGDFVVGDTGTYTISVSNVGTRATLDTIAVVDTLPAGLTYISGSGTGWTISAVGQVVTALHPAALSAGANTSFQLTVAVGPAAVPSVTNRAHVSGGGEVELGNNTASDPTTVIQVADLQVTKTGPAAAEGNGSGTVIYLITTTNHGPTSADVVVTDTLPPLTEVTFLSASRSATRTARVVTWPSITLARGASVTDTIRVRVDGQDSDPDLVNIAAASSAITDPDLTNNTDSVTTDIVAATVADVAVSKVGPATVLTSDTIRYVITTTNLGTAPASDVVLIDSLPASVTFVSATRGGAFAGGVVTWPGLALANGASVTDTVTVVPPATPDTLLNVAAATSTSTDPDLSNNDGSDPTSRATTEVILGADLSITKTDGITQVIQGRPLSYTLVAKNAGPRDVTDATVTDVFPAELSGMSWTCTPSGSAACSRGSGTGNIVGVAVDLPVGDSVTFVATGTVIGTGTIVNTATVTPPAFASDPTSGNNTATDDDTQILVPGVTLSSAADQAFNLNGPPTAISPITVTEGGTPTVTAANNIRIRIPAGFNMTWRTSDFVATIGGPAASKVSNIVTYEDGGRTLVIDVLTDFAAADALTISGLGFDHFTALSSADNLELVVVGAGGLTAATDDKTKTILESYGISSAVDQTFAVADPSTATALITITDAGGIPTINTGKDIRIRIPTGFPMTWDPTVTTVTLGGSAAGKVNATVKGYEDANQTVYLEVLTDFAAGDQLTVSGLRFQSFTATAGLDNLELDINDDNLADALDDKSLAIGAPTISSAANQNFPVGAAPTPISVITVTDDPSFPTLTVGGDLRIRIPAGFPMTWDTADLFATLGGSAAGKVQPTVSYEDGGHTLVLDVVSDFHSGDVLTIADLGFANFTASAGLNRLQLVVSGAGGGTTALDAKTISIGAPAISSAANQSFVVGAPATAASVITITDDPLAATIRTDKEIRIRIPTGFPMTWDPTVATVTLGGTAAGKVSASVKGYEDVNRTVVLDVTVAFTPGNQLTVTGLRFANFTAPAPATHLELDVTNDQIGDAFDDKTKTITPGGAITISSAANQAFNQNGPTTAISTITVSESGTPSVTAANDLRIRIPAGFPMTWLTSDLSAVLGGSAAAKVSPTVSYEDAGHTLVLNVLTNFAAGDVLTIGGLSFANFTAVAPANNLSLVVAGAGGATAATDDKTKRILDPYGITSAVDQRFAVADPATAAALITITDAGGVPTINTGKDIRIRIPTGYPMTWDPTVTTVTLGGSAAGKVNATVNGYEDANQTVYLEVLTDFAAGDQLTVNGLRFTSFTARAGLDNLELDINDDKVGDAFDPKTLAIGQPTFTSAANQNFMVGAPVTAISPITVTDDASFPTITAAEDIRIRIPTAFPMTWNTADLAATLGGSAASKVSPTVSYASGGKVLVLNVLTDFAPGDVLTIADLGFANFTATAGLNRLQLVVSGTSGGGTTSLDAKTISIGAPTISSAANQSFVVGNPATLASVITITDAASAPTINTGKDIRIRIPTGFPMTWDPAVTTVTLGGSAAGKVNATVKGYEDGNKTVYLEVLTNFAAGNQVTITGLRFQNFTATAAATHLELDVTADQIGDAFDDKTKSIGAPKLSSAANQNFTVGGAPRTVSTITVTEDAGAGTITASGNLRIRIPAGFPMTWLTSDLSAVLGGSAAAKVSSTVSYEDAGHTLVLDVLSNFAPGDVLTITGLSYTNFTATAGLDNLELVVSGSGGGTAALDDKTISIGAPTISSAVNQIFSVGDPPTGNSIITITDDPVTPTIRTDKEIRIRIPTGFNMTWNPAITTVTLGGPAAAKVKPVVKGYEDGGKTVVLDVDVAFVAGDRVTVSGLEFMSFSATSPPDNLELDVTGDQVADAFDSKTIQIDAGTVYAVAVSPPTASASRLPSNGTNYTVKLTITNQGNRTDSYDLLTSQVPGGTVSVVSITGVGVSQGANPDSARISNLPAGDSTVVTVTYTVAGVAEGTVDTLVLTARSVGSAATSDDGKLTVTVARPRLTLAKDANPNGTVPPGTDLTYTITFTNDGSENAVDAVVVDSLPSEVRFKVGTATSSVPIGIGVTTEYSNNGGGSWTYVPVSLGCGAPATYDACVTHIRWSLQNPLSSVAPNNSGTAEFVAQIK